MGKPRDLANLVATGNILADGAVAPAELTGVTATASELNILDGVTATATELNLMDGVTATTAELNHVDGVTSNVQTQLDAKAPVASPTFTGTATAPTINASTALQIGGVAVTATAAELNIMDGVTATASELNIMDGVTATTSELNYNDITTLGTVEASKVVTADANGDVLFPDGEKLKLGTSGDLEIFHDHANAFSGIVDTGTGPLAILTNQLLIQNAAGSANLIKATEGGAAELLHSNVTKLETTALGIDVSGELIADSYNEKYVSLSAAATVNIDCHTGNVFALTTNQNTTFTFSNPPASGTAYGFTLKLTAGGTHTITYPNTVDFAGATAPDAPASGETDVLVFFTVDGGTNWYGALAIDAAG